ncbi:MAG: translation initiation factor IF-3 [Calditrichales bacterium]|nr:MAG: translation initiation factor IF-3 [Calditrichales bacterium]
MKKDKTRINQQITAEEIRLISSDGGQIGIVPVTQGIKMAEEEGLDLVEISPDAKPPVCKVLDYGKFRYEVSKKEKDSKKKQHVVVLKEIRLRPRTEEHDFEFKIKHARKFLEQKNKVKFTVLFRGREMAYKEFGEQLLDRVIETLDDIAKVESEKKLEGRRLTMTMIMK